MKKNLLYTFLLAISIYFFTSCSKEPIMLEFSVLDSTFSINGIDYPTDYCNMQVFEDPDNDESQIINIPVIRIRSKSEDPGAPIFFLNDGPGVSNLNQIMPLWLIDKHDLVIIGYRGVDGSVNLDLPEFTAYFKNNNFLSENNIKSAASALKKGLKELQTEFDIKQYNINNMAKDVESARTALQYEKINIYASGFGSRIAQAFSHIARNSIFRIMLVHPNVYGTLSVKPENINETLSYYDMESEKINNGLLFNELILKAIEELPDNYNGYIFDKDRLVFHIINMLNRTNGAALVNEACKSSLDGNYESMIALNKLADNFTDEVNLCDYLIKSITSEYNPEINYFEEYSYNSDRGSIGSPLAKFIFSCYQKSNFDIKILDYDNTNPGSLSGECLAYTANMDILANETMFSDELQYKYSDLIKIIASDYCKQDIYNTNITNFSKLIAEFLYIGNHKDFIPQGKEINLVPAKTLKQLESERL